MLKAAKFRFSFVEKQFVCELEWVRGCVCVCVNGKRWNCFFVQSSESLVQVYTVHAHHSTCYPFNDAFSLPFLPAVAIFRCCCCCFHFSLLLLLVSVLLLISFLFIFVVSLFFSCEHTKTFATTVDLWFTNTLQNCNHRIYSAHECTHLCKPERTRERSKKANTIHKLTITTKFSSQKYWLLDAEHTFNTSVCCAWIRYYPKIGADNATLKMNSVKTFFSLSF